jgi:hypothetical protein
MKVDWFMVIVLAGAAPAGIIFVLLWWRTSGRWAHMKAQDKAPPPEKQIVVKSEPPRN